MQESPTKTLTVRLPAPIAEAIEERAARARLTVGAFLRAHLTVSFAPNEEGEQ